MNCAFAKSVPAAYIIVFFFFRFFDPHNFQNVFNYIVFLKFIYTHTKYVRGGEIDSEKKTKHLKNEVFFFGCGTFVARHTWPHFFFARPLKLQRCVECDCYNRINKFLSFNVNLPAYLFWCARCQISIMRNHANEQSILLYKFVYIVLIKYYRFTSCGVRKLCVWPNQKVFIF